MIRQGKTITLSKRLQAIADMVPQGRRVADVGCDHGFLDIYLVQDGKIPGALAMDVRTGPLAAATAHVKEAGLEEQIETRLSDGLSAFQVGEAQTLVCAGMGGPLMQRILTAYSEKTESFQDFLLQPQSEIPEFRAFLRENGYKIVDERILEEDGKYYFPMRAVRRETQEPSEERTALETKTFDEYGELLLKNKEPLLMKYLTEREKTLMLILERISGESDEMEGRGRREGRLAEIKEEIEMLHGAMDFMGRMP